MHEEHLKMNSYKQKKVKSTERKNKKCKKPRINKLMNEEIMINTENTK